MRMLLTSAGLANESITVALSDLLATPFRAASVVVVLTASLVVPGDKRWVIKDLKRLDELGFRQVDMLDLGVLGPSATETRLREADVVFVEGGDHYHLARMILERDLVGLFEEMLAEKVYVGVSAGSMVFTKHLNATSAAVFRDEEDPTDAGPPFGLFDWYLKPHWHSDSMPDRDDAWVERIGREADFPVYILDDDSAVRVRRGDEPGDDPVVDVVSEGDWRLLNG